MRADNLRLNWLRFCCQRNEKFNFLTLKRAAMNESTKQLTKFYEAAFIELPMAAAERWFNGKGGDVEAAGWAAYDSLVALGNELTNQMYANPLMAATFGRTMETVFQFGYILDAFGPLNRQRSSTPVIELKRPEGEARSAGYAEAAAQYRTAAQARRLRRAAA
jgi:hypothetical protein